MDCSCMYCDTRKIHSLDEFSNFGSNRCHLLLHHMNHAEKLLKKGYKLEKFVRNKKCPMKTHSTLIDISHIEELVFHKIFLVHPKRPSPLLFKFPRFLHVISYKTDFQMSGFLLASDTSIALLKFKPKKQIIWGSFLDLLTSEVKHFEINKSCLDKENITVYLRGSSLWIIQNGEIGLVNVSLVLLSENPVRHIQRNFGTMDYWNPVNGKINVTENEIQHEFLHVELTSSRVKLIRKQVQTLKNKFIVPMIDRSLTVTFDSNYAIILFEFYKKEKSCSKFITSYYWRGKFDKKYYNTTTITVEQRAAVRINKCCILILDYVSCQVCQSINLEDAFTESTVLSFQFTLNGNWLYFVGCQNSRTFWECYRTHCLETLRDIVIRKIRQWVLLEDIQKLNIPKLLRNEISFVKLKSTRYNETADPSQLF